jgi:hypothetical protein
MGYAVVTYTFANNTNSDATQVNQNFTDLTAGLSDGSKDLRMANGYLVSGLSCLDQFTMNTTKVVMSGTSGNLTLAGSALVSGNVRAMGNVLVDGFPIVKTQYVFNDASATVTNGIVLSLGGPGNNTMILPASPVDGTIVTIVGVDAANHYIKSAAVGIQTLHTAGAFITLAYSTATAGNIWYVISRG